MKMKPRQSSRMNRMVFWEAMQAVTEGKYVRHRDWDYHLYVYKNSLGDLVWCYGELYEGEFDFNLDDRDWELYE